MIQTGGTGYVDLDADGSIETDAIVSGGAVTIDTDVDAAADTSDVTISGIIDAIGAVTINAEDALTVNALIKSVAGEDYLTDGILLTSDTDSDNDGGMTINAQLRAPYVSFSAGA